MQSFSGFRRVVIPGDGLCAWHALTANDNLSKYEGVPRNDGGYPLNHRLVKAEAKEAKELCSYVCNGAMSVFPEHRDEIKGVLSSGTVSPLDFKWIAPFCELRVRVTCGLEAGRPCTVHILRTWLTYPFIYIYIYLLCNLYVLI